MSEHSAVCKALAAMLHGSGEVTEEQVTFVGHAAFELGLSEEENAEVQRTLKEGGDYEALLGEITSKPSRVFLFRRVVAAVLLDDKVEEHEQAIIDSTAKAFGYSDELKDMFVAWMQDGIAWEKRGAALMAKM